MAANEEALGSLHTKVCEVLNVALDGQQLPAVEDDEGNIIQEALAVPPSAAIIAAATKFLKDNNITCVASKDNALGALEEKMRARQEKRAKKGEQPNVIDFDQAREDARYAMGGGNA